MAVFFAGGSPSAFLLGDFGVYYIIIGLIVIITGLKRAGAQSDNEGRGVGVSVLVYILVLLVATAITGKIDPRLYYCDKVV
jgi:hypothetical protein